MPRQNRVTPLGDLIAVRHRGTFMGNRGVLHDEFGQIRRTWQLKRWIVCVLEFRGRHRTVMTPGRYTELFFLDEATALAAGHRPCAECRRRRFHDFCNAWTVAHSLKLPPIADEIDERLHAERVGPGRSKRTYVANLDDLPDGTFVRRASRDPRPYLVLGRGLILWSEGQYGGWCPRPRHREVDVLTPKSTVAVLKAGYVPDIHPFAMTIR
jgi:hypothetical protein